MKTNKELIADLANYIIDSEYDDYLQHCEDNNLRVDDIKGNANALCAHIYAVAMQVIEDL